MSLEDQIVSPAGVALLDALRDCLRHTGKAGFNEQFLKVIGEVVRADQCMIFSYRQGAVRCYLSYNVNDGDTGRMLADDYVSSGYREDPLIERIEQLPADGGFELWTLAELRPMMPDGYYQRFIEAPGLGDKITILARGQGETVAIGFYRFQESGCFVRSEPVLRQAFWALIAELVLLHYSRDGIGRLKSPLSSLSEREREVCEAVLRGLTTDGIAAELALAASSVTTYRKRAYIKLGIHSKTALFALCASQRANEPSSE